MKRVVVLIIVVSFFTGCSASQNIYTHVSEQDYISNRYYLSEISPRDYGELTPCDFGVFEKCEEGFLLLVNIGRFTDIYGARHHTLVNHRVLYLVCDSDLLRYELSSENPQKSETRLAEFFPCQLEVLELNAIDEIHVYVYAVCLAPPPPFVVTVKTGEEFKPYTAYFAVTLDSKNYTEISFGDIPVQKRY